LPAAQEAAAAAAKGSLLPTSDYAEALLTANTAVAERLSPIGVDAKAPLAADVAAAGGTGNLAKPE
jgi:hypothetical protein